MEEQNRPAPSPEAGGAPEKSEHGEARNRRRRGHRGGRHHGGGANKQPRPRPEAEGEGAPKTAAEPAPKKNHPEKKNHHDSSKRDGNRDRRDGKKPSASGQDSKRDDKRTGKNGGRRDNRGNRHRQDHVSQKDDIYGDPKEAQELAEWRAKIVLKSADGSVPSAPSLSKNPSFFSNFSKEAESEEVAIPEGIDLLGGPTAPAPKETDAETVEVIGVRFRSAGKMYYFDPRGKAVKSGTFAIVETARGPEFGEVTMGNSMVPVTETITPLRPLLRVATEADIAHNAENREKEKSALAVCQQKIAEHKLDMKLIDVQYAFDNSKLLFYFSAEGRVDFRELVKDLASTFHTRIELRQIGIRDEAKMLGGIGACGRPLCCSTFLPDFAQVSIKMAREQGLSLNSAKISGMCGRLMCCLRFETETYAEEIRRTPPNDSLVKTEDGLGIVIGSNPIAGTVRVRLKDSPDATPKQYSRDSVEVLGREKKEKKTANDTSPVKETSDSIPAEAPTEQN